VLNLLETLSLLVVPGVVLLHIRRLNRRDDTHREPAALSPLT
jgi:hypothetical protein